MSRTGEVDNHIKVCSEAAESFEAMRRDSEKVAEMQQMEKEKAIAYIYEMAGKIKAVSFFKTQSDFFGLLMLKKVKESKDYRERFGMTWAQFCEHVGLNVRTVDIHLKELEPFREDFLESFRKLAGATINKIKYLGKAVNENSVTVSENAITYNGEIIPLDAEHKDDIQSLLDTLEKSHKTQIEEKDTTIRTKDRLIKAKEDVIAKMERELSRLEKTVEKTELTEEEQDACNLLAQVQRDFIGWISDINNKIKPHEAPEIALRCLYFLYIFISKVCMEKRLELHESYLNADEVPWEITEMELPPTDILVDNLPVFAGRNMGERYREKIEERQVKANQKSKQAAFE
jgi:hypothetical protein